MDDMNICVFYLDNDVEILVKEKNNSGSFQVLLDNINAENIAKLKLANVGGLKFGCSMTTNQSVLVFFRKHVKGYEIYN